MPATINIARVYDVHAPYPANTFLTDRLWPRGLSKVRLEGVQWLKAVAPSNELRHAFMSSACLGKSLVSDIEQN